jgi:hypothetical protein
MSASPRACAALTIVALPVLVAAAAEPSLEAVPHAQ